MGSNSSRSIIQSFLPKISNHFRMKVVALVTVVFLVGSASALGSGPYLPSGWRPRGPAFLLPSELEKPVVPLKDVSLQVEEASGSDFLREYGPPNVVSQDITLQALPDVATEQSFAYINAKFADEADAVTEDVTLNTEEKSSIQEETATATETVENITETEAVIQGKSLIEVQSEESQGSLQVTDNVTEIQEEVIEDNNEATTETSEVNFETSDVTQKNSEVQVTENIVELDRQVTEIAAVEERMEEEIEEHVKAVEEGVRSIAGVLVTLENEIKAQQIFEDVAAKNIQETIGAIQTPQGFLEYGPPGFREYGPPKDDLLRSDNVVQEEASSPDATETNETRRRRFSPKFKRTIPKMAH